ncbi:hypothetical protein STVA_47740 [Allostella vacuolata]|nr:hypothetical protein STVA_47740 [Stella vacuolata]
MILTGGCACGAVRFQADGDLHRAGICHCMTCRKVSGSAFNAFVVYPRSAVRIGGETTAFHSSETGRRHFCPRCGAHVFALYDGEEEIELHVGSFDEPNRFRPTYEAHVGRREDWLPALEGLPQFDGNREEGGQAG